MARAWVASGLAVLLASAAPSLAVADVFSKSEKGRTAAGFLKLGVGARAMGMAEAYSAIADDATAVYWNPGAMTQTRGGSITAMHATYLDDSYYDFFGYTQNLGPGTIGASFQSLSQGQIEEIDANNVASGKFTPRDIATSIGYAMATRFGSFGLTGKFIRQKILNTASTAAADFGYLSPGFMTGRLFFSLVGQHIGGKIKFNSEEFDLPTTVRTGLAWRGSRYTMAFDGVFPRDASPYGAFGAEAKMGGNDKLQFALRAGYNSRSTNDVDGAVGFTAGLGLELHRIALDYAFVPMGGLGLTHRISMSYGFGGQDPEGPLDLAKLRKKEPKKIPRYKAPSPQQRYDALVRTAVKLIKRKKNWEALEKVRRAAAIKPLEPEAHILEGRILYGQKDRLSAKRSFLKSLKVLSRSDRRRAYAHERLGRIFYRDGDYKKAMGHYKKVINSAKRWKVKSRTLGNSYVGLGLSQYHSGQKGMAMRNMRTGASLGTSREYRREINTQFYNPRWNRKGYKGE